MCGIFGAVDRKRRIKESLLSNGISALRHRGPDGRGIWISDDFSAGLAHCRLEVTGGPNGLQPISNQDGSITVSVNGEFYGYKKIRSSLQNEGYQFKTNSDSEIAVHLYEKYGLDFVRYLRGEFSLLLYDEKKKTMLAVRDRFGIKPLVYWQQDGRILFASEAKALKAAGIPLSWDNESAWNSFSFQYVLPDKTLFSNVRQVPPGHLLIFSQNKHKLLRYWEVPDRGEGNRLSKTSETELIEQCRNQVVDAVHDRLISDSPACFHLSGGLDSSSILGIGSSIVERPLNAFCVQFENRKYNESEVAYRTSQHIEAKLHRVNVSAVDIIESFPSAVRFSEGFSINGHHVAKFLLHRAIKNAGFKVVLSGEGADEAFLGYGHLRLDDNKQPTDYSQIFRTNSTSVGIMLPSGETLSLEGIKKKWSFVPTFLKAKAAMGFRIHSLLRSDFLSSFKDRDPYVSLANSFHWNFQEEPIYSSNRVWMQTALANYILKTLGDGTEMAWSVEGRVPFLDHRLFEFAWMLPTHCKISDGKEKYVLRKAMKPFITDEIYRRQKHPFASPPINLLENRIVVRKIKEALLDQSFRNQPFFDFKKVNQFLKCWKDLSPKNQQLWDPIIFTMLSATFLHSELITQ